MAFVRVLNGLVKDKKLGKHVVPIIPDEARTFGMEGMFRQLGIYTSEGQKYEPVDKGQIMFYREDQKGQILEEGISEAGAMSRGLPPRRPTATTTLPCCRSIYYSMFGFQRIGDLAWAAVTCKPAALWSAALLGVPRSTVKVCSTRMVTA